MEQLKLLNANEVAKIMNISLRAVYRLADKHTLPSVKWDRSVRFLPSDVAKFIKDNRHCDGQAGDI